VLAQADERVARYQLTAPIAGTILDVAFEPGVLVGVGAPVVTLADPSHPYVDVFVPEGELAGIDVGDRASVAVDALAEPVPGRVEWVARTTEFTPRFLFSETERANLVVRVRVRLDDRGERLHAGVPAFATIAREGGAAR
jgi:HlyD family secretion protein